MVRWIFRRCIIRFFSIRCFCKEGRTSEENHTLRTHRITTLANEEWLLRENFVESVVHV